MATHSQELRLAALDRAVQINSVGVPSNDAVVESARRFYEFVCGDEQPQIHDTEDGTEANVNVDG